MSQSAKDVRAFETDHTSNPPKVLQARDADQHPDAVQVIRAGNMTVRVSGSATNLSAPAMGLPQVVMTPTCENRSTRKHDLCRSGCLQESLLNI
jgi:hypothetical protein